MATLAYPPIPNFGHMQGYGNGYGYGCGYGYGYGGDNDVVEGLRRGALVRWEPPPFGFIKINVDASVKDGKAGYGGLARDNLGRWITGFCGFIGHDSEAGGKLVIRAELLGILEGLRVARGSGFRFVVVETDSKSAVDLIDIFMDGNGDINEHVNVLRDIKALLELGGCYSVCHQRREGNFCADKLAKIGIESEIFRLSFQDPPYEVLPFLMADYNRVIFPRGVRC